MDKQQLIEKIKAIGTCEDNTNRLELLTQLQEEAVQDYDKFSNLEQQNKELSDNNEALRSANMKLFLRIGEKPAPDKPGDDDGEKPKREFKNLFNEKGAIK